MSFAVACRHRPPDAPQHDPYTPIPTFTPTATISQTPTSTCTPTLTVTPNCVRFNQTTSHSYQADGQQKWIVCLAYNQADWEAFFNLQGCSSIPASDTDFTTHRALVFTRWGNNGGMNYDIGYCVEHNRIRTQIGWILTDPPPSPTPNTPFSPYQSVDLPLSPDDVAFDVLFMSSRSVTYILNASSRSVTYQLP